MIRLSRFAVALLLAGSADAAIPEQPELRSFPAGKVERIYYSGPGTLSITQGDAPRLLVSASASVLDDVVIEFLDDALFIEVPANAAGDVVIRATLGQLSEIVSDGANSVSGTGLLSDILSLEAKGAGRFNFSALQANELLVTGADGAAFTLSGSVNRQVLDLADHGLYQAGNLHSRSVEAKVVGAGYILLAVDELLDVRLAGAASVRYLGTPFVSQSVSGSGSVAPVAALSI